MRFGTLPAERTQRRQVPDDSSPWKRSSWQPELLSDSIYFIRKNRRIFLSVSLSPRGRTHARRRTIFNHGWLVISSCFCSLLLVLVRRQQDGETGENETSRQRKKNNRPAPSKRFQVAETRLGWLYFTTNYLHRKRERVNARARVPGWAATKRMGEASLASSSPRNSPTG